MAEVLVTFTTPTRATNGDLYHGRVLGRLAHDGLWEGWIEFALAGSDEVVLTERETKQPNRTDLKYWAEGLSATYLEGALDRAVNPTPLLAPADLKRVYVDSEPRRRSDGANAPGRAPVKEAGPQTSTAEPPRA